MGKDLKIKKRVQLFSRAGEGRASLAENLGKFQSGGSFTCKEKCHRFYVKDGMDVDRVYKGRGRGRQRREAHRYLQFR